MSWLRDILTSDATSETYDLVRVGTFASLVIGLGLEIYVVIWRTQPFDFQAFGTGLGLLIAAGAGGMWARKDVEPPHRSPED